MVLKGSCRDLIEVISSIYLEGLRKTLKTAGILGGPANIRMAHLPKTSQVDTSRPTCSIVAAIIVIIVIVIIITTAIVMIIIIKTVPP
jgi:hypothetical protein